MQWLSKQWCKLISWLYKELNQVLFASESETWTTVSWTTSHVNLILTWPAWTLCGSQVLIKFESLVHLPGWCDNKTVYSIWIFTQFLYNRQCKCCCLTTSCLGTSYTILTWNVPVRKLDMLLSGLFMKWKYLPLDGNWTKVNGLLEGVSHKHFILSN